ncbi:MAG TPA: VOC family protein [Mycobacteriales bacterium]|nr:VOC family protein [Mycobacteriales bacterium]
MTQTLSNPEIAAAGLADWRKLAQALHARYAVTDPVAGAEFVAATTRLAGAADHLEARLTRLAVDLTLCTAEDGRWVTKADMDLAAQITAIARDRGHAAQPDAVTQLEVALDTWDEKTVGPFWSALLTGSPDNTIYDSVFDPSGRVPAVWFQTTDRHETPRQRWHFDLWLAPEVAAERIAAAVAAGGTVLYDADAPAFVVLADPDGNRVCVCTAAGRD